MQNNTYNINGSLLANNQKRFLNCVLDSLFVFILMVFILSILAVICGLFCLKNYEIEIGNWLDNISDFQANCIGCMFMILYYFLTEVFLGRSFAKFITDTIVVDEYGEKPHFSDILKRTFCRFIPFDGLSFLGNPGKGWHDSISNTYVVDKKELAESMRLFHEFKQIGQETE
jgi:uncharacterized RDD family membrane protein YckC